jgi:hypothetical protein
MYRMLVVAPLMALLLTACIVAPADRGYGGVVVAPALPLIVEIGPEPYYFHDGFHYYYHGDRWSYSRSRSGPWSDLPRSHYPKEIRRRGGPDGPGRGPDRDYRDRR